MLKHRKTIWPWVVAAIGGAVILVLWLAASDARHTQQSAELTIKLEAYKHAQIALLRENRGLSADRTAPFDADRVKQMDDVFTVDIPCDAMNIYGKEAVVNAEVKMRFSQAVWIAVTIPQLPGTVASGPGSLP